MAFMPPTDHFPDQPGHVSSAKHRYGCYNEPRPTAKSTHVAQAGWYDVRDPLGQLTQRVPVYIEIKSAFGTTSCQYDRSQTDASCLGCQHQKGALA